MACGNCTSEASKTACFVALTCKHARATGYTTCELSGEPLTENSCGGIKGKACLNCPIGRGPDGTGIVRWMGLRWRGLPYPKRLLLCYSDTAYDFYGHSRPARRKDIPGCGCWELGKRAWERARTAWRAV